MHSETMPTVTILIDTYNYARFVTRAIDSALAQEYRGPQPEILVVDDGSTDNTAEVVRRYADRVRYRAKDNGGQASALNVGLREATGDIVCLLDGDDYFYPGKVQLVADAFRHRPEVGLVYNEFELVDRSGTALGKVFPEPTWTGYRLPLSEVADQLRSLILLGHPWTCITSAMSLRRSIMAELAVPEDVFPHSPDLFLGLVLPFVTRVAIVESRVTAYVYHGDNVGLFRSSAANRATYERQMAYIRRFVEERCGARFLPYYGRSIYGPEEDHLPARRWGAWMNESRQIAAMNVDPLIARRSRIKLAAAVFLPDVVYSVLRTLRATQRSWQSRSLWRGVARARAREVACD